MTKTEDQIAKHKEAVAKMIGAKDAMQATLDRIKRLEAALQEAKATFDMVTKNVGDSLALSVSHQGKWEYRTLKIILAEASTKITQVL